MEAREAGANRDTFPLTSNVSKLTSYLHAYANHPWFSQRWIALRNARGYQSLLDETGRRLKPKSIKQISLSILFLLNQKFVERMRKVYSPIWLVRWHTCHNICRPITRRIGERLEQVDA